MIIGTDAFFSAIIFVFGLVVGSFLNVVIFRLGTSDSIVNGRSKCFRCQHQLRWYDLFPLLSFLALGGRCRYCGAKLSWQYPLVELGSGVTFAALFAHVFGTFDLLAPGAAELVDGAHLFSFFSLLTVFSALTVIFVYDLRHYVIPDEVVFPAIAVAFLLGLATRGTSLGALGQVIMPALVAGGFFLFLVAVTRGEGMGGGDVKLGVLMGLLLGFPEVLFALFIAFVTGALVGLVLVFSKKKGMKSMVPFGPFLVLGTVIAFFCGNEVISWYRNLIGF